MKEKCRGLNIKRKERKQRTKEGEQHEKDMKGRKEIKIIDEEKERRRGDWLEE